MNDQINWYVRNSSYKREEFIAALVVLGLDKMQKTFLNNSHAIWLYKDNSDSNFKIAISEHCDHLKMLGNYEEVNDEFIIQLAAKIVEIEIPQKRKCYIAGYLGELTAEKANAKFEKAKQEVIALGFEPVSPLELPHNHNHTWPEFMREDLIAMLQCDVVYVQNDVRHSHGTKIEVRLAMDVQIDIIFQK